MDLHLYKTCPLYQHGLQIEPGSLHVKPCCWFTQSVTDASSYADYKVKYQSLNIAECCKTCIEDDLAGRISPRQRHVDINADPKLGIVIDNRCNLACVTCDTSASVKLIPERVALQWVTKEEANRHTSYVFFSDEKLEYITQLTTDFILDNEWSDNIFLIMTGGEVLKSQQAMSFLDKLVRNKIAARVHLHIITNGTVSLDKIADTLAKFRTVRVNFSIDGTHELFNFMRFGADFKKVDENIRYELLINRFQIGVICTVSWINLLGLNELVTWADNLNLAELSLSLVYDPAYFSIFTLPEEIRALVVNQFVRPTTPHCCEFVDKVSNALINASDSSATLVNEGIRRLQQLSTYRQLTLPSEVTKIISLLQQK